MNIPEDKVRLALKCASAALAVGSAVTLVVLAIIYEIIRNGNDKSTILFFGGVGLGMFMATPWPDIWPLKAIFGIFVFFAEPRACLLIIATAAMTFMLPQLKLLPNEKTEKK